MKEYEIQATDSKVYEDGSTGAGDTVDCAYRKSLKSAKSTALRMLSKKGIYSVWVETRDEDGDLDLQLSIYKGDKKFRSHAL